MKVRRCAILMIEPRERLGLDLTGLFDGRDALASQMQCVALAPHLDAEITVDACEVAALIGIGETPWLDVNVLAKKMSAEVAVSLLDKGLLIGDGEVHARVRERDEAVRATHWHPLAAVAHYHSRWTDTGVDEDARITRHASTADLVGEFGLPPTHEVARVPSDRREPLPVVTESQLDRLFRRRITCRNFDTSISLTQTALAAVMHRVFGYHAVVEVVPGVHGAKRAHPSGGGLHPLEAYLLVRDVDGIVPGLFHYHVGDHALERLVSLSEYEAARLSRRFVGGQRFFAEAHVHIALVARFGRTFWKYRNHAKAYRAIVLEAGHVSQDIYLSATEEDLGAYVTAAINEVDIEQAFGLDPLSESPVAVCGFGARAPVRATMELDPLGMVWDETGRRR